MKRSKFSLSHYRLQTMNMGFIVPITCVEVLPGDSLRHAVSALLRVSPLVAPVMHPVHVRVHCWFVPNRLVWNDWEAFITGRLDTTVPQIANNATEGNLADYLGVPPVAGALINALPIRSYNLIYNEFYRDQDLIAPVSPDGNVVQRCAWEKDYFTTARPFPQQGTSTEAVQITFSGNVPVRGIGMLSAQQGAAGAKANVRESDGSTTNPTGWTITDAAGGAGTSQVVIEQGTTNFPNIRIPAGAVAGSMDINAWRRAMALQKLAEHRNRFGSRYTDYLRFLGITPSDARLNRPEYLGGGKQTVSFSEVLATADSGSADVGSLAGHGIAAVRSRPYNRFFEEHGHVIAVMLVRPKTVYTDGVDRNFLRRINDDYWQKEMEMMGDQPITNAELFLASGTPTATFGFIPRHDDYRRQWSTIAGGMRSTVWNPWHFARDFSAQPVLNQSFIECTPATNPFAAPSISQLQLMAAHHISARRLVSKNARN